MAGSSLIVLFLCMVLCEAEVKERCLAVVSPDFEECHNLQNQEHTHEECSDAEVCKKEYRFSDIQLQPFVHILEKVVISAIEICCGKPECRNHNVSHYQNETISLRNLTRAALNSSNFIFPVLGKQGTKTMYGFHFIPLLELSNGYLVTEATTSGEILTTLITSCLNLWPLLVIIILLAIIAGFIAWVPETWFNPEEFPRMFFLGLFESFWWAFVSITTVGYGDKAPKFVLTRLWSVFWILVGITICSIFTASLTNEITSASNPPDPTMLGKTIGVFRYRAFDAAFVAKHGGNIKETRGISEDENIHDIKDMLSTNAVDGIFMDKYTYMYALNFAKQVQSGASITSKKVSDAEYFLKNTQRTKVEFDGEKMTYGILVREEDDYDFFEEYIRQNQIVYETCALLQLNEKDAQIEEEHDIFSAEDKDAPFYDFLYVCVGIIAGIIVVGIVFEVLRKYWKVLRPDQQLADVSSS